jgi:ribose 1,5-bisphosphokinase
LGHLLAPNGEEVEMPGKLIYVMGPSGAGKDSLIDAARPALHMAGVQVARRIITRSAESVGEQAESLSPVEFAERARQGGFALYWHANGLSYGISRGIDAALELGQHVLVNGSRAYLPTARERYPGLIPVWVTVESAVLRERLLRRGRESLEDIERRLARNVGLSAGSEGGQQGREGAHCPVERLDNSDDLASAARRLMQILQRHAISAGADRT